MYTIPCHRNSDDITSFLADKRITQSGWRCKQVELVEMLVRKHSGYTCRELSAITGHDNESLHKRLPESNKIKKGDKVKCLITGFMATTWVMK